jgi:hypothetical protein
MELLLGSFVGAIFGVLITILAIRWMAQRLIQRLADIVSAPVQPEETVNKIKLKLEFDQNNYFMYNVVDGSFVVQGESIVQLRERLNKRFPDCNATVVDGDPEVLAKLRKEIESNPDENSNSIRSTP